MRALSTQKVFVQYRDSMKPYDPVLGRKYTITHSDITAELFVFIADNYAIDQVTSMHDDVKISWEQNENQLFLIGSVLIDGPDIDGDPAVRNRIFYTEMPTALKAMRQADRFIFEQYPNIDNTPVLIRFLSENPTYNKTYNFGPIGNYRLL